MLGGVLYKSNQLSSTSTHRPLYEKTVWSLWAPDEAYGQWWSCGNGQVDGWEQCDDGNGVGGDGCSSSCRFAWTINAWGVCGDGVIQWWRWEQCDDGNWDNGDSCTSLCFPGAWWGWFCGDGTIQTPNGEQCDDGNTTNGDGCRLCQRERPECILLSLPTPTYKGVVTSFNMLLSPWINNSTNRVWFQPLLFGDGWSMSIGGPWIYNHLFVVAWSFSAQWQVTNTLGGWFGTVVCTNPVSVWWCGDGVVQWSFGEQCESWAWCDLTTCQRAPPQCGLISSSRSPGGPYTTWMTLSWSFSTSQPWVSFLWWSTRIISPTVLWANTVNLFLTNPWWVIKLCPVTLTIAGCGDGVVQAGEQCDGQTWCNNQTCQWTLPSCDSLVVNRSQSPPYIAGTSLIASLSTNQPDISIVWATSITINPLLVWVNTINATIKNSANIYKLCTVSITAQWCGDGVVQAGEQCDDGNALWSDGCWASCQYEKPTCILDTTPNGWTAPLITAATRTLPSRATATLIDRWWLWTINNPSPWVTTTIFTPWVYTVSLLVKSTLSWSTATWACSTTITVSSSPLAGQCGSLHGQSYYSLQWWWVWITSSSNGICALWSPIWLTYDTIDHTRSWIIWRIWKGDWYIHSSLLLYCSSSSSWSTSSSWPTSHTRIDMEWTDNKGWIITDIGEFKRSQKISTHTVCMIDGVTWTGHAWGVSPGKKYRLKQRRSSKGKSGAHRKRVTSRRSKSYIYLTTVYLRPLTDQIITSYLPITLLTGLHDTITTPLYTQWASSYAYSSVNSVASPCSSVWSLNDSYGCSLTTQRGYRW